MDQRQHEPYRRRRPALSCLECRRRKLKCDRSNPCGRCVSTATQCNYRIHQQKPGARHRQTRRISSSSVPSPAAAPPASPPSQVDATGGATAWTLGPNDLSNTPGANEIQNPSRSRFVDPELHHLRERVQRLERSLVHVPVHDLSQAGRDVLAGESGMPDARIILNKTRIMRWSHWVGIAKEFAPIISCYGAICGYGDMNSLQSAETRALIVETSGLLQKCKSVARNLKIGRPSRCLSSLSFDLTPPSREVADKMTALYFQSFESTHRILHEPTFWKVYNRFWSNPESASSKLRLQVLLVIAIGSSLAPHVESDAGLRHTVHQWIYAAETWLSGPLEKDRLDISGLQIHCLVMLARQIFSIGGDLVWISSGSLIHRGMQIGLHRDPKHLPPMSILQAQLRRRLWATILELVVQSSLDSALPPRISFEEFDTEPPANSNDNEIRESATELKPHTKETFTSTSMQLILLDSLPMRLQILNLLNGLNSELSYLDVLDLSTDILQTCRQWNAFARENKAFGVTPFHRNLLDYLLRRFLIPLHCPFANKARMNPLFHYSLKVSIDTATTIVSPEPDEGFSNLMAIGGGLFREGIRYATSIISLELLAQAETQYLDGTLHRNSHYMNPLKKVIEEMKSLSLERIRQGETNVKSYMFLCMITAQAEATEEGISSEGRIAKSARDSISLCLELLQNRLGTTSLSMPTTDIESTSIDEREDYTYGLDFDMDFFLADTGFT
ncbi:uncharacterized protein TRIVIDRAFT_44566 [Trichoderma virens Gv29-8]|uniref:Zn(2)-C6 fungal-type domain-containing protein n=1 Tax=Hypocrea virens (strain Gv29-8 / FGSC 10586) TaxID=413071 RepID=G9N538_HYPVG|nr:uncharacterized protein TRIVIDRAFT_44566 [Trichoderma virens Gv29-8]EHK17883.1 hypothetical protein TRIVIDRAFT_44566 [Trichoderma virens Gv29-8]UKZ54253.1 hypothetical protein TrVGV298_008061 [Trichoderma virens]